MILWLSKFSRIARTLDTWIKLSHFWLHNNHVSFTTSSLLVFDKTGPSPIPCFSKGQGHPSDPHVCDQSTIQVILLPSPLISRVCHYFHSHLQTSPSFINPLYGCLLQDVLCMDCRLTPWRLNSYGYKAVSLSPPNFRNYCKPWDRSSLYLDYKSFPICLPATSPPPPPGWKITWVFIFSCNHPHLGLVFNPRLSIANTSSTPTVCKSSIRPQYPARSIGGIPQV